MILILFLLDFVFIFTLVMGFKMIFLDYDESLLTENLYGNFGSLIASIIFLLLLPHFKGQIASIVLTGISTLAAVIFAIQYFKKENALPIPNEEDDIYEDEMLEDNEQTSRWEFLIIPGIGCQIASIIIHITGIYFPQIRTLLSL